MQTTFFSSVTALILIAVKQIFKCRIPPLIGTMMWVVLLARLVCPIFPESSVSVYNFLPIGKNIMVSLTYDVGERIEEQEEYIAERDNPYVLHGALSDDEEEPVSHTQNSEVGTHSLGEYLTEAISDKDTDSYAYTKSAELINLAILVVYALGITVTLCWNISAYFRAKRNAIRTSFPCTDEKMTKIYRSAAETAGVPEKRLPEVRLGLSSMVVGCAKPCIICRDGMGEREAWMTFAHELIHCTHNDNALLLFSTIIACFYWYNPLIWVVRAMLREDVELLCDSRTLEKFGIVATDYAMMLCRNSAFSELAYTAAGCKMSASGRHLKNRLKTISLRKRRGFFARFLSRVASIVMCSAIILLCLTNPIISQSGEYTVYIEHYAAIAGEDENSMQMRSSVTVSEYLEQIGTLVTEKAGADVWKQIGGNLEKFKRLCESNADLSSEVKREIRKLKTDELLTNKNCALIGAGIRSMLSGGAVLSLDEIPLLPEIISAEDMDGLLSNLTENEKNAVLSLYNRGVRGANVKFERVYTEAMMELILSRINDDWQRMKVRGFYQRIETDRLSEYAMEDDILESLGKIEDGAVLYFLDSDTTQTEENHLRDILRAAVAGEDENIYYLKESHDETAAETAAFLFYRAGYTHEKMLLNYAEIGENGTTLAVGEVAYPILRDSSDVIVRGTGSAELRDAVKDGYAVGIIDAEAGIIDVGERLTLGESLAYAYRLVYFAISSR